MRLILSVGGARGSFQAGAISVLLDRFGAPLSVHGNSVGALNGALVASGYHHAMEVIWGGITNGDVYRHRTRPLRYAWAALRGRPALDTRPLREMIDYWLMGVEFECPFTCGHVDLWTGAYAHSTFEGGDSKRAARAVYDSAAIPFLFPLISRRADGGARHPVPLSDALPHIAADDLVVIVSCHPLGGLGLDKQGPPISEAARMFEVMQNAMVNSDVVPWLLINRMLTDLGLDEWEHPETGKVYRPYQTMVIAPPAPLPWGMLDFDGSRGGVELGREAAERAIAQFDEKAEI